MNRLPKDVHVSSFFWLKLYDVHHRLDLHQPHGNHLAAAVDLGATAVCLSTLLPSPLHPSSSLPCHLYSSPSGLHPPPLPHSTAVSQQGTTTRQHGSVPVPGLLLPLQRPAGGSIPSVAFLLQTHHPRRQRLWPAAQHTRVHTMGRVQQWLLCWCCR